MEKRVNFKVLIDSPDFENPKPELEQYSTPIDIAINIIKFANSLGHLSERVVDLGTGTGRLAIGAAIAGAKVTAYEIDEDVLNIAKKYAKRNKLNIKWINEPIEGIIERRHGRSLHRVRYDLVGVGWFHSRANAAHLS